MVKRQGPSVGVYMNRPIPGYIVTDKRVKYIFDRLAWTDQEGGCELKQLAWDECVIAPGLIYKLEPEI